MPITSPRWDSQIDRPRVILSGYNPLYKSFDHCVWSACDCCEKPIAVLMFELDDTILCEDCAFKRLCRSENIEP